MKPNGKEVADKLTDFVNNFNCDHDEFIEAFCRQHRTLQQSSFRLILGLIERMASDDYYTDGRNEQSKEIAKTLINGFKSERKKELLKQNWTEEEVDKYLTNHCSPKEFLGFI